MKRISFIISFLMTLVAVNAQEATALLDSIVTENDKWQSSHSPLCSADPIDAVYFIGNMEAYRLTGNAKYYEYADSWCRHNKWKADNPVALRVYMDMNTLVPVDYKVESNKGKTIPSLSELEDNICKGRYGGNTAAGFGKWLIESCRKVRELDNTLPGAVKPGAPRVIEGPVYEFSVVNPTARTRQDVVELNASDVFSRLGISGGRQFVLTDGDNIERPYQLTADGKILLQAFVAPKGKSEFTIRKGLPKDYRLDSNGHFYPDRMDDLGWENDRCAWRIYGPAMAGKAAGFDTFTKNVPYPKLDKLYHNELSSYDRRDSLKLAGRGDEWPVMHRNLYNYHHDFGEGMDAYPCGNTLGAGAPALWKNNAIIPGDVFVKADIVENGPLRFKVNLTQKTKGDVNERRTITQDVGSHLARIDVEWDKESDVVGGIVVHQAQPDQYVINRKEKYLAVSDALDTPQGQYGQLLVGCYFPQKMDAMDYVALDAPVNNGIGHVVARRHHKPGDVFTYYAGSAWSRYDVPTMQIWEEFLKMYAANLRQPMKVVTK